MRLGKGKASGRSGEFERAAARRAAAVSSLCFASVLAASGVPASAAGYGDQAEWAQVYDAAPRLSVARSNTPVLSQSTLDATAQAIETYRKIVANGGWNTVPGGATLRLGGNGSAVVALRKRLAASGDLIDAAVNASPVFDSFVEAGVKRFQARHGLLETGIVNKETLSALNAPADFRLHQLEINLVRLRSYSGNLGERFVMANIPAMAVETVENGVVATHHAAGVGKIDRQSPVMMTKATDINFNPYWTVPPSLIKKDLIPKMLKNPNYLTEHKIRIFDKDNQEVQPSQIDWNTNQATNYRYRQDPGGDINSLGVVRINISNPYGVYMHDTPEKGVFGDDFRFVSSGCIRVQNVRDYVAWLLKDTPGWGRPQIDEAIRSGQRIDARLAAPVPVYWVYITAWASPDGVIQFRDDIYQRDGAAQTASAAGPTLQEAIAPGAARPVNVSARGLAPMSDDEQ